MTDVATDFAAAASALLAENAELKARISADSVIADNYPSLQAACADAVTRKLTRVVLTPGTTYTLTETLTLPNGVALEGGGGIGGVGGAKIATAAALDPMIQLSGYSSVRGCYLNGFPNAIGGVYGQATVGNAIENNSIFFFKDYGLKFGGCLFTTLKQNTFSNIGGYSLDALAAHGGGAGYYGINVGLSERNQWNGAGKGAWRVEGILTSLSDNFEPGNYKGEEALITIGGAVQSQIAMNAPYIEMKKGVKSIYAIKVSGSAIFAVRDGQFYGDASDTGGIFLHAASPEAITVEGCKFLGFNTVFHGMIGLNASIEIHGNRYYFCPNVNAISNFAIASAALVVLPGTKIGI